MTLGLAWFLLACSDLPSFNFFPVDGLADADVDSNAETDPQQDGDNFQSDGDDDGNGDSEKQCVPETFRCLDNDLNFCTEEGNWVFERDCASDNLVCLENACVVAPCIVDTYRCQKEDDPHINSIERCTKDGVWEFYRVCGDNQICREAFCVNVSSDGDTDIETEQESDCRFGDTCPEQDYYCRRFDPDDTRGVCVPYCYLPGGECPNGTFCDQRTTSLSYGWCVDDAYDYICENSEQCPKGYVCLRDSGTASGYCGPRTSCTTDRECPFHYICDDGACRRSCTEDSECVGAMYCSDTGLCTALCYGDSACPYGQFCDQRIHECISGVQCCDGAICRPGHVCNGCTCQFTCEVCDIMAKPCNLEQRTCTETCQNPENCSLSTSECCAGFTCKAYISESGLYPISESYCSDGQTCPEGSFKRDHDGECQLKCRSDNSCAYNQFCEINTGRCRSATGQCSEILGCPMGFVCDMEFGTCVLVSTWDCKSNNDLCPLNYTCTNNRCTPYHQCGTDNDCGEGFRCIDAMCNRSCTSDQECGSDLHCDTARNLCFSSTLCSGQYCPVNKPLCDSSTGGCYSDCSECYLKGCLSCDSSKKICTSCQDCFNPILCGTLVDDCCPGFRCTAIVYGTFGYCVP